MCARFYESPKAMKVTPRVTGHVTLISLIHCSTDPMSIFDLRLSERVVEVGTHTVMTKNRANKRFYNCFYEVLLLAYKLLQQSYSFLKLLI